MKIKNILLPGFALGIAAALLAPTQDVLGYTTLGHNLPTSERHFRVHNSFADNAANDNTTIHPNWPGFDGAELAIWKGAAEWGSVTFGDGTGDPLQSVGSGGANCDLYFAGNVDGPGAVGDNVISTAGACMSGVTSYCEVNASGWRIRFCEQDYWTWHDGPGDEGIFDIQGYACHLFGYALGLGRSTVPGATMEAMPGTDDGVARRSIEADDIAGLQSIYGAMSATKPLVTSVVVNGRQVTITGSDFSTTRNEVWFTSSLENLASADPHVKVTNLASTGGGTQIVVTAPLEAGPGNVLVQKDASGHASLSNAHPCDLDGAPPTDPYARFWGSPTSGPAPLLVAFVDQSVGTNISSWYWNFGNGDTSTTQNDSTVYDLAGLYTVSLSVTGSLGTDTETKLNYIDVAGGSNASATTRNGSGVNPNVFVSVNLPVLGTNWNSTIDGSSLGASGLTFVVGYTGPHPGLLLGVGELLIDVTSAWAMTSIAGGAGGLSNHSVAIPSDPAFAGFQVYTQGFFNNVGGSGLLTNAIDLNLGY